MNRRSFALASALALVGMALSLGASRPDDDAAATAIRETQVGLRLANKQFQATVIARRGDTLTIVTAAHCLSDEDEGGSIRVRQGDAVALGRVVSVARNPDFRPVRSRDPHNDAVRGALAVDSAVATIRLEPGPAADGSTLAKLQAAELTPRPIPEARDQLLVVRVVDQEGVEHIVRAGNHLHPKCLAWGNQSYRPTPGDSGSGVFLVRKSSDGSAHPLLIGNVALVDDRGGIAPLVSRRARWISEAIGGSDSGQ
jgi:hypothetical protein